MSLYLGGCDKISDISNLGKLHTLNLYNCNNITDVSMLGRLHTLNLTDCNNINDVSMLGKVHTLIRRVVKNNLLYFIYNRYIYLHTNKIISK